jgi:hypothetical protein
MATCTCGTCYSCCASSCENGCPVQLDFSCVLYHKDNNETTELDGLELTNGATLELVIETIDEKVKEMNLALVSLPVLEATYVVNTITQFSQAVDTELGLMAADIATALAASQEELAVTDSATIDFTASGTLNHSLTASVKLSAVASNRVTAQLDGIHVAPQTLSVNTTTKELTISDGNTVNIGSLVAAAPAFLGNVEEDPSAVDGQYWYNTAEEALKIKVGGLIKTITTT